MSQKKQKRQGGSKSAKGRTGRKYDVSLVSRAFSGAARTVPSTPAGILDLAEQNYLNGQETSIVEKSGPIGAGRKNVSARSDAIPSLCWQLAMLTPTNSLMPKRPDKLVLHQPQSPDPWFVLTYVRLSMREYNQTIAAAEKYIELLAGQNTQTTTR